MKIVPANNFFNDILEDVNTLLFFEDDSLSSIDTKLMAVGDISFSGQIGRNYKSEKKSPISKNVINYLNIGDIVISNFETSLVENHENKLYASEPESINELKRAGFNFLHLANNHIIDFGEESIHLALESLEKTNIIPIGAGGSMEEAMGLKVFNANEHKIGIFGCGKTLIPQDSNKKKYWEFNEEELLEKIKEYKPLVNVLILSLHLGHMYVNYPRPAHRELVKKFIANGVDIILMHHAHVLQGVEIFPGNKICFYNLGNFLFDFSEGNVKVELGYQKREGGICWIDINKNRIQRCGFIPTFISDDVKVDFAYGQQGIDILQKMIEYSDNISNGKFKTLYDFQRSKNNTGVSIRVFLFHLKKGNFKYIFSMIKQIRYEHIKMIFKFITIKLKGI